jgi:hypothetical protein
MEIANYVVNGVRERFSIQYFDSCIPEVWPENYNACCGGNSGVFADLYNDLNWVIPWSNTNASFTEGNRACADNPPVVACASIPTTGLTSITTLVPEGIPTIGVGQTTAINNIKNVLHQSRGVEFDVYWANDADLNDFFDFWDNEPETKLWNADAYCAHAIVSGQLAGHGVIVTGYNDTDPDPSKHYWEVLNSWGTTAKRPNGVFRMPMRMNYDCTMIPSPPDTDLYASRIFSTQDVHLSPHANLTPYKPSGWSDKIVVSNRTGTTTDASALRSTDTLYLDWAIWNNGSKKISKPFRNRVYVDGVLVREGQTYSVDVSKYVAVKDFNIGKLSKGVHTIRLVTDAYNDIAELREDDNEYTKTITVN